MTNAMLAVFGLSGSELVLILATLLIGGLVLIGLGLIVFLIVRILSRKSESSQTSASGKS
jgi:hypothetical protein